MPFHLSTAVKSAERIVNEALRLAPNIILGIIVFIIFVLMGSFTKWLIRRAAAKRNGTRPSLALLLGRLGQLLIVLIGVLVAFSIAAPSFRAGDIIKMLGIGTVAIGFAFQNILQNFLAGILLLVHQPFQLGDMISVSGMEGKVEDIEARATVITTKDGNKVVIPNATVFTNPVTVENRNAPPAGGGANQNPPAAQNERENSAGDTSQGKAQNGEPANRKGSDEKENEDAEPQHSRHHPRFFSW